MPPNSTDDHVYIENDAERAEYVENDKGKVYVGQHRNARWEKDSAT